MIDKIIEVSDSLNYNKNYNAYDPTMQVYKDELYCMWYENNSSNPQLKIKKFDGYNWINTAENLNYNETKYLVSGDMQVYKDELYCAWSEHNGSNHQIKIKKYNGNTWTNISANINYNGDQGALNINMKVYRNELYCAWGEYNTGTGYQIKIKKYNGSTWINISNNLNYVLNKNAERPIMKIYRDELYCIWWERTGNNNIKQIKMKKYNGNSWINISSSLNYNVNNEAWFPEIQAYKDELYCVWQEINISSSNYQIKMKKYNGINWSEVSDSLNYNKNESALYPKLQVYKNELYCAWREGNSSDSEPQIKIKKYNGVSWSNISSSLNGNNKAGDLDIKVYKDELYFMLSEADAARMQAKIKKYNLIIQKFLIKQNNQYYLVKSNLHHLGWPINNTQLKEWYYKYGSDCINIITQNLNIKEVPMTLNKEGDIWKTDFEIDANQVLDNIEMIENDDQDNYRVIKYDSSQYRILDELNDNFEIVMAMGKT